MARIAAAVLLFFVLSLNAILAVETDQPAREKAKVAKVYDGDTLLLEDGRTIRLLGIDAPEIHHPTLPPQRFGVEAMNFVKSFAEGKDCELEFEAQNKKDVHGRSVAYMYVSRKLLNAELLKGGFAFVYVKYDFKLKADFVQHQKEAIKARKGLWKIKDKSDKK